MAYLVDELMRLKRMALSVQQQMELTSKEIIDDVFVFYSHSYSV